MDIRETEGRPQTKYRKDYTPPDYFIRHVDLAVDIGGTTEVEAVLHIERNPESPGGPAAQARWREPEAAVGTA
ncbi:MAG: hypothetical protein U5P41_15705 [Gammaproteobacteria bacterium]|nr:hypothetical protein [Gammaproteobacteria bacterium]